MSENNDRSRQLPKQDPSHEGAVAQDRPGQPNNTAPLNAQIDHRDQQPLKKGHDTDFPEPGSNPEYSMQKQENENLKETRKPDLKDPDGNAESKLNDQDPGERQKRNQGDKKNDDLAA